MDRKPRKKKKKKEEKEEGGITNTSVKTERRKIITFLFDLATLEVHYS
jgi:hypothetical protein